MYEIILGRDETDKKKYGSDATILLGKHYVTMGQEKSLANPVLLDVNRPHVILVSGKRGGGKCLEENTLITLSNGQVLPIKDLEGNKGNILALQEDLKIRPNLKTEFYKRKVNKLLHIKLRSGREIKLTPEHPLLTILGWKPAEKLEVGSRIATPRKLLSFGDKELDSHKVKLLAYLIAEGCLRSGFVLFSNADPKILEDFSQSIKEFDSNLRVDEHGKPGCYRVSQIEKQYKMTKQTRDSKGRFKTGGVRYKKSSIRQWLEKVGIYDLVSLDKYVPEEIFTLPKYQLALFLNRLFSCDGSIYRSKSRNKYTWEISYSSSSEKLIRQVQHVLLRFEILSKLRRKTIKCNDKSFKTFELLITSNNVERFLQEIGFFGAKQALQKQAATEVSRIERNPNIDTIPQDIWKLYKPENWAKIGLSLGYKIPKSLRESQRYSPSRQKLMQISIAEENIGLYQLATSDIFWDEILKVKELCGDFTVYDISVPEHHNFVANDMIVHNSYSLGVMAEGIANLRKDITQNISVILFDTMGIYWTMKFPNYRDDKLLQTWKLEPKGLKPKVYVPSGLLESYKQKNLPVDSGFSIKPVEVNVEEWCEIFSIDILSPEGLLIERAVEAAKSKKSKSMAIKDIFSAVEADKDSNTEQKLVVSSRFKTLDRWGLFDSKAQAFSKVMGSGQMLVLDLSAYSEIPGGEKIKALVIRFVADSALKARLLARKTEEVEMIREGGFMSAKSAAKKAPLLWILIDEAHEFLPREGKTLATTPLVRLLREGRQPGISLVLATQQPGKIHTDVLTQSDIVLSHRITAKDDVEALNEIMHSYLPFALQKYIDNLPAIKGAAIVLDDTLEKIYPIRVRPRISWHGGEDPSVIQGQIKKSVKTALKKS